MCQPDETFHRQSWSWTWRGLSSAGLCIDYWQKQTYHDGKVVPVYMILSWCSNNVTLCAGKQRILGFVLVITMNWCWIFMLTLVRQPIMYLHSVFETNLCSIRRVFVYRFVTRLFARVTKIGMWFIQKMLWALILIFRTRCNRPMVRCACSRVMFIVFEFIVRVVRALSDTRCSSMTN